MDCETFQEGLPDLLYGELAPESAAAARSHLTGCASCAAITAELEAVKGALPAQEPPPLLAARVKLAARDELLARAAVTGRGGPLHVAATLILALCLAATAFGLGVAFERRARHEPLAPELPIPRRAEDVVVPPDAAWVERPQEPPGGRNAVPRAPEAWQRVLFDAATDLLARGDVDAADEFFQRAAAVCQEGPLTAAARVGQAEVALRRRDLALARRLLGEVRAAVLGGQLPGGPALLQRISELDRAAREPP